MIMKRQALFLLALTLLLLLGAALAFWPRAKKKEPAAQAAVVEVEGKNLTYLAFNKKNEKKLEVKCEESQKAEGGRLRMKKITAVVFQADTLEEDVHISAASALTAEDFSAIQLQGDARIVSPTFTLTSASFELKDQNELSTRDAATFKLRDLSGRAKAGLLYVFNRKTMRLLQPDGTWVREGEPFQFQARMARLNERKRWLILDHEARLTGANSSLSGERIVLQFDQDFAHLQDATVTGSCSYQGTKVDEDGRISRREITADRIKMTNDPQGRLRSFRVSGNGDVALADAQTSGRIRSAIIEINLNAETQSLEDVRTLAPGELSVRGRDNLTVSAGSLQAVYDARGVLARVKAENDCAYATDDFSGRASLLDHDVPRNQVILSGREATVVSRKNSFAASRFVIRTRLRSLAADQGVKATLVPEKKSVLLARKPAYVTASALELGERGDVTRFKGNVKLFQDEMELHAGELLFESRKNRMSCRGGAELKFVNGGERLELGGTTMTLDPGSRAVRLEGEARMRQGENALAAGKIDLAFGPDDKIQDITAFDDATFKRKDLSGKARQLLWQYARGVVRFKNSAEITRRGAGTTRGQELLFNLESNEITVFGADERSETTIRQERP